MKPQLFVIGMSRLLYRAPASQRGNCHREPATKPPQRPTHKFDYSPQELSTIIEWRALERAGI